MGDAPSPRPAASGGDEPLEYPTNRVIGAVEPAALASLVPDLIGAGFAPIGILAGEAGLRRLAGTGGGDGVTGALRKLMMSMGGDLDYVHNAEKKLRDGRALVDVEVDGDAEKELARDVMLRHGGEMIVRFTPWAIEILV